MDNGWITRDEQSKDILQLFRSKCWKLGKTQREECPGRIAGIPER